MKPISVRWRIVGCLLAGCLCVPGCGANDDPWTRAAVDGMVQLDGRPLETGQITFFPADGNEGPAAGAEIVDGRFSLSREEGPVVGANRVVIRSVQPTGRTVRHEGLIESDGPAVQGQMVKEYRNVIPAKYNSRSKLVWKILSDTQNTEQFELTTE